MLQAPPTYRELRDAYKNAEAAIHDLGLDTGQGADIPAVNELRYAGHHVLQSIVANEAKNIAARDEQLVKAMKHCARALYDVYDSAVFYRLSQFSNFQQDYATVDVAESVPDYAEIVRRIQGALARLRNARLAQSDRSSFYTAVVECYPQLEQDVECLESARDELNKVLGRQREQKVRLWAQHSTAILAALSGAAAALLVSWMF